MTDKQLLAWIKANLRMFMLQALWNAKRQNPQLLYTSEWLAAMTCREVGWLLKRYIQQGRPLTEIHGLMKGDYGQRPGEKAPQYHGFGYMQIDCGSYPNFTRTEAWKDPFKVYEKAIAILDEKRIYLQKYFPELKGEELCRAVTAAYNCGQGNVREAIRNKKDIDSRTYEKNYSAEVWRYRAIYKTLP